MLTVILAEHNIIEKSNKYKLFLKPLLENKELTFCKINPAAENIDDFAPELHKIINNCGSWRALIIAPVDKNKLNPFDFTGYKESLQLDRKKGYDWSAFSDYLKSRQVNYDKAVENPLTKLTFALGRENTPVPNELADEYESVESGKNSIYKLMVNRCLGSMNVSKVVTWIRKYGNNEIENMFSTTEEFDEFLNAFADRDAERIIELIGVDNVPYFCRHIGADDTGYSDPYYVISQLDEVAKETQLKKLKDNFTFFDSKPEEIICIAERCCDLSFERINSDINIDDFAFNNLYPSNAKFIAYDILPENHKQFDQDFIKFLTFILVTAANEFPDNFVDSGFLYVADAIIDKNNFFKICGNQDARLAATLREITQKINDECDFESTPLENYEAREAFESNIRINVPDSSEFNKGSMRADYNELGLSGDCPKDEFSNWVSQYKEIEKKFTRYLREPRRLVKTAVKTDFPQHNSIDDDRIRRLNEFQKEDILFRLREEERNMVNTKTTNLFNSEKYVEELKKSSDDIKKTIKGRMSRKTTICIGLAAGAAFLVGFMPMLFSNLNTLKSFGVSAAMTVISLAVFLLIGFITLFSLRKKLKSKFIAFNTTLGSIFSDISNGLRGFSDYLSHACNVMRENSVLRTANEELAENVRIMKKHILDINRKRSELREIYSDYFEIDGDAYLDAEPFAYDFESLECYDYDVEYTETWDNVEYIEPGKFVSVPIDYLKSVMLTKEKDYDR